jgi:aminopeptidase N
MISFIARFPNEEIVFQAIPDFGPGAMENWGLITYREPYLLYDPLKSSVSDKYSTSRSWNLEIC